MLTKYAAILDSKANMSYGAFLSSSVWTSISTESILQLQEKFF